MPDRKSQEFQSPERYYRVREVAASRSVKEDTVLNWIHSGELVAIDVSSRSGGRPHWRIAETALTKFDRSRAALASPPIKRVRRRRDPAVIEFF